MKTKNILFFGVLILAAVSCKKVGTCECKTTWVTYDEFGAANHEEIVAYPLKDTKANMKKECDVFKTNMNAGNPEGYYTSCEVK